MIDVLGKIMRKSKEYKRLSKMPKFKNPWSDKHKYFNNPILHDRRSHNELTHSQAQSMLPQIGKALMRGGSIDPSIREDIKPYIQVSAPQYREGGVTRFTRGTGYRGPADPIAQALAEQGIPTTPEYVYPSYSSSGDPFAKFASSEGKVLDISPVSGEDWTVTLAKAKYKSLTGKDYPNSTDTPAFTKIIKDSTGKITGYLDTDTGQAVGPTTTSPATTSLPPEFSSGFGNVYGTQVSTPAPIARWAVGGSGIRKTPEIIALAIASGNKNYSAADVIAAESSSFQNYNTKVSSNIPKALDTSSKDTVWLAPDGKPGSSVLTTPLPESKLGFGLSAKEIFGK